MPLFARADRPRAGELQPCLGLPRTELLRKARRRRGDPPSRSNLPSGPAGDRTAVEIARILGAFSRSGLYSSAKAGKGWG
jgi:hypothetical protein